MRTPSSKALPASPETPNIVEIKPATTENTKLSRRARTLTQTIADRAIGSTLSRGVSKSDGYTGQASNLAADMSAADVSDWLKGQVESGRLRGVTPQQCEALCSAVREHDISGPVASAMDNDAWKEVGATALQAAKLIPAIRALSKSV